MSKPLLFTVFKTVARAPFPGIGLYRMSYIAATARYGEWSDKAVTERSERQSNPTRAERVDHETWLRASKGLMSGYVERSDLDAPVVRIGW